MTATSDAIKRRRRLLAIRRENDLTNAGLAELAGEGTTIKTVEHWLADPAATSYRPIPAFRMELIELRLRMKQAMGGVT